MSAKPSYLCDLQDAAAAELLFASAAIGDDEGVALALSRRADPNAEPRAGYCPTDPRGAFSSLALSLRAGSIPTAQRLLNAGADPAQDRHALAAAVRSESESMVSQLLRRGSDPNSPGVTPSPLTIAARSGLLRIVQALLDAGADPKRHSHAATLAAKNSDSPHRAEILHALRNPPSNQSARDTLPIRCRGGKQRPGPRLRQHGESCQYLAGRLRRDHLDIYAQYIDGSLSIRQAARAAGILKRQAKVSNSPESIERAAVKLLSRDQLATLAQSLNKYVKARGGAGAQKRPATVAASQPPRPPKADKQAGTD